ncbi:MAG TPA: hypothetical protein VL866_05015 [Pyrinomonadaceae bacterium]|nr:hypothetical protein [Pyrinomonadaceae bacterium]
MLTRTILSLLLVAMLLSAQSCQWLSRRRSNIDKPSPTRAYRVKFESTVEDTDRFLGFHEWGSIQYLKGADVVYSHKWDYTDSMEDTVMGMHKNAAWLGDNVLYMGGDQPVVDTPMDEITISNTTLEHLNYATISFSKHSHITVFDLPAAGQIRVRVPPVMNWRYKEGQIDWSFGFGGGTRSKREFAGARRDLQKTTSPTEMANLSLEITEGDFR